MSQYVKIRSWHIDSGIMSRGGMILTLCGRWAPRLALTSTFRDGRWAPRLALTSTFLVATEKSCESCLRNKEIRDR